MPELPEVETIVRTYRPRLVGRRFVAFSSRWPKQASPSVPRLRRAIVGRTVTRLDRRGKYIVFQLAPPGFLLVHLRMSGRFEWAAEHNGEPRHVRTIWTLDNGNRLLFCDARKFGRIIYTDDLSAVIGSFGVEPLERGFTSARLRELLRGRARQLKPLLLDQSVIAGLGNIYTDEALFVAGLHPLLRADQLKPGQVTALRQAIRSVLREAIRRQGTSFDWAYLGGRMQDHLRVYGRTGEPCQRCGSAIQSLRVAQRGTHICPKCQPRGRKC